MPISSLHENEDNIREDMGDLEFLAEQIKQFGVQQPLTVYPHPQIEGDYIVRDGNRRYLASLKAQITEVPCIVKPATDRDQVADVDMAMTTGRTHKRTSDAEVSHGIQRYFDLGQDVTTIGKKAKMSRKEVLTRAKVAQRNDGLSKAYTSGRLGLDAVQRLQDLEDQSGVAGLYERSLEKIEGMPNGASVETVERIIAETEVSIRRDERKAELEAAEAIEGNYEMTYSSAWAKVEDEMSDQEHVKAGHRYHFAYRDAEPTWYAKEKKAKPELSEAEKLEKQTQSKLNSMLSIVSRTRRAFIAEAFQSTKADEAFAKQAIAEQIFENIRYDEDGREVLGEIIGLPVPEVDAENPGSVEAREQWSERVTNHLSRFTLANLGRMLAFSSLIRAEEAIGKLKGFERSRYEGKNFRGAWIRTSEYYLFLMEQLGYELDLDEVEAMQYSAAKEPQRNRELDLVEVPDDACQSCGTEPFEPTGATICTGCAPDEGEAN
ncbi:ParB/RepB/Spo0J family partition protein [Glutamicibacter soli]|uniref:ParB/RepB/Spo0J family partition protein n=1 Tax=Glutamicibacter soli TaxID=453836 RepID=UPI003FD5A10C